MSARLPFGAHRELLAPLMACAAALALGPGCATGGETRRMLPDGGADAPSTAPDAPVSTCDPPCDPGFVCSGGACVTAMDADGDGVPSDVDCDDSTAAVGRMAERPCSSSCADGVERCTDGVWAACTAPTSCDCTPGSAPRTVACMNCGTQRQICDGSVWVNDGGCTGAGPCAMGTVETGGSCGNCGMQTRTCGIDCTWGAWACAGEGVCAMGATESRSSACGACGEGTMSGTRTCTSSCTWGSWVDGSCTTSATCAPGATDSESRACTGTCGGTQTRMRSCSSSSCTWGAWGSWSSCPTCGPVCGNGSCESGETCSSCASDCRYGHGGTGTNGESCSGVPLETWRCVTDSVVCGGNVSQVCRDVTQPDGSVRRQWVSFNCNPRNCSACFCAYSISCNQ